MRPAFGLGIRVEAYRSNFFRLSRSLGSPPETDPQSSSDRASTRGANDPIVSSFPFVRWDACKSRYRVCKGGLTSQFSRMKQSPPATDLRGGKASAESLTPRRVSLAVADALDFQSNFFSSAAALGSVFSPGRMSSDPRSGATVLVFPDGIVRYNV